MIACPNINLKEWKDLVAKHGENKAYVVYNEEYADLKDLKLVRDTDSINIQRVNQENIQSGNKTMSVRPFGEHNYSVGDVLKVKVKGNDTGLRVKVSSIKTIDDFTKLTTQEKDEFARSMGDYKDFEDFRTNDDYAKIDSPLSIAFPEVYKFITGQKPGDIISYSKTETLVKGESKEDKKTIDLLNHVRSFIEKKIKILTRKDVFNKKQKQNELKRLQKDLKDLDGVSGIFAFIDDAYEKTKAAEQMFLDLLKKQDTLSNSEMIARLSSFNEFVNGYSILDEISKADLKEVKESRKIGLQEEGNFSIQQKLAYAIERKDLMRNDYIEAGLPLLADYLLQSKSEKLDETTKAEIAKIQARIDAIQKSNMKPEVIARKVKENKALIQSLVPYNIDRETLINELRVASKDEGAIDFWFSPLISSDDSVLALFAKSIKSSLEDARLKDIKDAEEYKKVYEEFAASNTKNKDNVASFNDDIYEVIEVASTDEDGNRIYVKKKSFVQKYNLAAFEKAKDKFFKELGPKPSEEDKKALAEWKKSVSMWFRENTEDKSQVEIDAIVDEKEDDLLRGIITKSEYEEWRKSVFGEFYNAETHQLETYYKNELKRPSVKYINKKWDKLYLEDGVPNNAAGKYHKFMLEKYLEAQDKLPEHFRMGYILPSRPKDSVERSLTQGALKVAKNTIKDAFKVQIYDTEFGISSIEGDDVKFLPVYFTQNMDVDDVSSDVLESVMKFTSMANKYEALNKVSGEISLMEQIIGERQVIKTNSKGEKIIDAFAAKMGFSDYIKKHGEGFSEKHVKSFINMIVRGEMQEKEEILGLDAGKITNKLLGFSSITTLAVDFLKSTANNIQGNIQVAIEANSGEYFNKKNLTNGSAFYIRNSAGMIKDFGKIAPDNIANKLVELYDAIQGEYTTQYGENVSGSLARKLFRTDTLFFNQHIAEHEIQVKTLFAILDANYVKDNESGELISVLEAYKKYGIEIESKTDFTDKQRKDLMNINHAISKRLHGVYNSFDKAVIQKYSLGRLLLMYRKYLVPSYKRRFKKISGDQELGGLTEGTYRTFWRTFIRDLRDMQFNIVNNWESYTDFEKDQIKRTLTEAGAVIALTALVMVLKGAGDDDEELKKNYFYNFVLYQAVRQRSETAQYYPLLGYKDAYRTIKSPTAMITTMDRSIKLIDQLIFTWDKDKLNYKKKTGVFDKGTNRSYAAFLKLVGLSGYNADPAEAIKSFEGALNK